MSLFLQNSFKHNIFAQDNPAAALPLLATLGASALAAPQLHGGAAIIV